VGVQVYLSASPARRRSPCRFILPQPSYHAAESLFDPPGDAVGDADRAVHHPRPWGTAAKARETLTDLGTEAHSVDVDLMWLRRQRRHSLADAAADDEGRRNRREQPL
jgi:hypothetical protein